LLDNLIPYAALNDSNATGLVRFSFGLFPWLSRSFELLPLPEVFLFFERAAKIDIKT
jgi:hypothetical protein